MRREEAWPPPQSDDEKVDQKPIEIPKDNVIEHDFQPKDSEPEIKSGSHQMSMKTLEDLGYSSYKIANEAYAELKAQKEEAMLTFTQKLKDKILNGGDDVKRYTDLEAQVARLGKALTLADSTARREGINLEEEELQVEKELPKAA